jgi:Flp pilus assembly protein TadG
MTAIHALMRRARLLARQESGMAAVEFSLILPILVVLWLGGVEMTEGLSVDRRLNNLAAAIGDLSARSKTLTYADVNTIFNLGPAAMYPYATGTLKMRVTAVNMDASKNAKVAWSRGSGITAYAEKASMNSVVPATLRVANSQIIMAETYYTYTPTVGYMLTGGVPLSDRLFFVPRLVNNVSLCTDSTKTNCKS